MNILLFKLHVASTHAFTCTLTCTQVFVLTNPVWLIKTCTTLHTGSPISAHIKGRTHTHTPAHWLIKTRPTHTCTQVCVLTNPVWLIKTRMQLQQHPPGTTSPSVASSVVSRVPSSPAGAAGSSGASSSLKSNRNGVSSSCSGSGGGGISGGSSGGSISSRSNINSNSCSRSGGSSGRNGGHGLTRGGGMGGRPSESGGYTIEGQKRYRGFLDAMVKIGREEGLRGYYKGLGPSLVLVGL